MADYSETILEIQLTNTDQRIRIANPRDNVQRDPFIRIDADCVLSLTNAWPRKIDLWRAVNGIYYLVADVTVSHVGMQLQLDIHVKATNGTAAATTCHHVLRAAPRN